LRQGRAPDTGYAALLAIAVQPVHLLWLLAPGLSLSLLGAHFYRAGAWPMVLGCALLVLLLAWPRAWAARLVQACLVARALEWLWTAFGLVQARIELCQPWLRLALIIGAVALITAASALVFRHQRLRERYAAGSRLTQLDLRSGSCRSSWPAVQALAPRPTAKAKCPAHAGRRPGARCEQAEAGRPQRGSHAQQHLPLDTRLQRLPVLAQDSEPGRRWASRRHDALPAPG
jgi:hypothetical protein